ncbi:hypothetical protein IEQ34_022876 [Dendrobium chrysotoxum]|uniref:NB-ARC domain-containing protein n=1 Tax=Dendrobium chrysotoxum TaxID=161865 RepID=A0AAV7FZ34_DENCH|nr:hypothetical protein IEQ34_022876 [Dendrobium chrysotoxum]
MAWWSYRPSFHPEAHQRCLSLLLPPSSIEMLISPFTSKPSRDATLSLLNFLECITPMTLFLRALLQELCTNKIRGPKICWNLLKKEKPNLNSLDALQRKLKEEVMSKRFLLVLEGIWGEEEERHNSKWENVLTPPSCGCLGSKILVTTRMDSASLVIAKVIKKKKETLTLQGIDEDECLQHFNTHAFADVKNLDYHKKLRFITGQIAKKHSGSPLAVKVMGGILNSNLDEMYWRKVLYCDTGIIKLGQNDIMPVFRFSYVGLA